MGRRRSSAAGSDMGDSDSVGGSLDYPGSRTSGGGGGGSGRKGRRGGDDSDEDFLEVDPFDAAVEQLYEKRAATREAALSTIVSLLAQYRYDDCAFREDTLTQLFLSSVRRGKEAEAVLAAKALGLHVTTLGASSASEAIYQEAERVLDPLILTGRSAAARVAAAEALSMLCFIGSEGAAETLHTMHTLWRVVLGGWKKAAAVPVVVAALRGWAFLLTTVPGNKLDAHFVETHLGLLAQLLNGSDVEVRGAAGEAIALLWDMGDLSSLPESPRVAHAGRARQPNTLLALAVGSPPKPAAAAAANGSPGDAPAEPAANGSSSQPAAGAGASPTAEAAEAAAAAAEAQPHAAAAAAAAIAAADQRAAAALPPLPPRPPRPPAPSRAPPAEAGAAYDEDDDEEEEEEVDSLEAIVDRMRDLAKNRGDASRLNKGDRASSRSTFRDLLAIIQGEYVPETRIKLRHGDLVVVSGLLDTIRLNYLRAYLAEAFQAHMQSNELLHEVFRFSPSEEAEERLTPLEKRLFRSKSSTDVRDRTEVRRKQRATMASYKHGSLTDYS
ncbi:hypothetical protein ABPG75_005197 [Micractinium tetrahymenae]